MPIPDAEVAVVEAEKLVDYLLNPSHPVGGPKAKWFMSLGFSHDKPEFLAGVLLDIARQSDDYQVVETPYGVKYVVNGLLVGRDGKSAPVRTVWIVESGDEHPRHVTACPGTQE
jgi:hypothetical protein